MSSEIACQAVALCEGLETSLDISGSKSNQRFLDFARNDTTANGAQRLFEWLDLYHDMSPYSGAMNMAIDEALLELVTVPSMRFYGWRFPALSFGYFGRFADVVEYGAQREIVRRWTGGGIVFHGEDLTYSIVIPVKDPAFSESSMSIYEKIHRALIDVLASTGAHAELAATDRDAALRHSRTAQRAVPANACFANPVHADVMLNGCKIAGAAQRRTLGGLLQQGSIQDVDLGNDFPHRFARKLSHTCIEHSLPSAVQNRAQEIAALKYGTDAWLRKR